MTEVKEATYEEALEKAKEIAELIWASSEAMAELEKRTAFKFGYGSHSFWIDADAIHREDGYVELKAAA
jgi:hypothetical protein